MSKHKLDDGASSQKREKKRLKKERKEALKYEDITPSSTDVTSASTPVPEENNISSGYVQTSTLTRLPQSEIDSFLTTNSIATTDPLSSTLRPLLSFTHLPPPLHSNYSPLFSSFPAPTTIQSAAWPHLLSSRDVIGIAETGSGKTLAFGLPLVVRVASLSHKKAIRAVVIAPTRELAIQVYEQIASICKFVSANAVKAACIYGGTNKDEQRASLKKVNIVVATPGRLKDFMSDGTISVSKCRYLVLDEADRMLDKGFEDDIKQIVSDMPKPPKRQTAMFTATWPKLIRDLAATFMIDPVRIHIGQNAHANGEEAGPDGELRANPRIKQVVEVIDPFAKQDRLLQLLKQHTAGSKSHDRILVFCLYKKEASRVEETLSRHGFSVAGIHGDLSQSSRIAALTSFKSGRTNVLVATDVAARGLDIPEVKVVINNTFPLTAEDYVHRIGRTGRAGKDGLSITLFTEHDKALAGGLVNVLKGAGQPVPEDLMKFGTTVKKKLHDSYGAFYKDDMEGKTATKVTFDD